MERSIDGLIRPQLTRIAALGNRISRVLVSQDADVAYLGYKVQIRQGETDVFGIAVAVNDGELGGRPFDVNGRDSVAALGGEEFQLARSFSALEGVS